MPRKPRGWKIWVERGGNHWRCRWEGKYGTGQNVFVFQDDALELRRDKRRDFERLDVGLPPLIRPTSAITVAEWSRVYLERSKKEKSFRTYRNFDKPAIENFVAMYGNIALAAITDEHIREWKFALESHYGGTTAAMHFRQIRAFFNAAIRAEHVFKNPAKYVAKPTEGRGGRALRDEELIALMTVAPEELYRAGTFSLNTMLRIDEVSKFDWSWVWELPNGKWMGKVPANLRKTRKKVTEDCVFPLNPTAREVMGSRQLSGRVFPWKPKVMQDQIVAARREAKLPEDITFHCFRHTGASRYLANEGHMEDLLKSHLWNDPRSLLRYIHIDENTLWDRFSGMNYPNLAPKCKNRQP